MMEWTCRVGGVSLENRTVFRAPSEDELSKAKDAMRAGTEQWLETWDSDFAYLDTSTLTRDRLMLAQRNFCKGTHVAPERGLYGQEIDGRGKVYKLLSDKALEAAYALNAGIDWYKAALIANEIQIRANQRFDAITLRYGLGSEVYPTLDDPCADRRKP